MADGGGRQKRNCVSRKNAVPSSVHYVGYVEDQETPEMIMKKFEELERIMNMSKTVNNKPTAADNPEEECQDKDGNVTDQADVNREGAAGHGMLTDDQLKEVFRQTSIFNVKTALQNNDALLSGPGNASDGDAGCWSGDEGASSEGEDWEYLRGFWSDDDGTLDQKRSRRGLGRLRGPGIPKGASGRGGQKAKHTMVAHYNRDTNAFIRRKVKVVDPNALVLLKPPAPPLPLSWGRAVKPYQPPPAQAEAAAAANPMAPEEAARSFRCCSASSFDFNTLDKKYQALLINPGWATGSETGERADDSFEAFQKLPVPKLCPVGFIFVWVEKRQIMPVVRQLYKWGYIYVENLTWVLMHPNNSILRLPSTYANKSHITMLIFRKECEEGRAIELRHQRSPDVVFDCVLSAEGLPWRVPSEAYAAIETLLPTGKGKFLEIWGANGVTRPGWDHIVQLPTQVQ